MEGIRGTAERLLDLCLLALINAYYIRCLSNGSKSKVGLAQGSCF